MTCLQMLCHRRGKPVEAHEHDVVRLARALLDAGATVDEPHHQTGKTALQRSVTYGRRGLTELLLQRGADPDRRDFDGKDTWASLERKSLPLFEAMWRDICRGSGGSASSRGPSPKRSRFSL